MSDIRTNSPCCSVLLWTSFCFLQVNQQKYVGMVSTNNITYSEQIYKPFQQKSSQIVFLIQKRCPILNSYFIKLKKAATEGFYNNGVLKNFAIFTGKHQCEIFKNTYFEKHLHTVASELTLKSDCLKLCFWITFKTISTQEKYKSTSHFQTRALKKFGVYALYIFNHYSFL